MRKTALSLVIVAVLALASSPAFAQAKPDSLYKRVGGYDAVVVCPAGFTSVFKYDIYHIMSAPEDLS